MRREVSSRGSTRRFQGPRERDSRCALTVRPDDLNYPKRVMRITEKPEERHDTLEAKRDATAAIQLPTDGFVGGAYRHDAQ